MAVVTVSVADSAPFAQKWEMPNNYEGIRSPIPRGLITFTGTDAIATLSAGDETSYQLLLTMPPGFAYLLRLLHVRFVSDNLVANFGLFGHTFYSRTVDPINNQFSIVAPGVAINNAVVGQILWAPVATAPKLMLRGGDQMGIRLSDMDAGGSTAGDMLYFHQFYIFDIDQIDKWEVNTPIPVISHSSF